MFGCCGTLHGPNYHVHVLNLGARARFVGCGTSAPVSLDGKLRIYFGKSANPTVLHLSGMCVSHRDTPVPIEDTTSLQPSPSRWQVASLREDGRAHTIHLFVFKQMCLDVLALARTNGHLFMWNLPEGHERFSVARWQVADLRRQERESDGPSLVWYVCQSPRHARAHRGHDIIATVALIAAIVGVTARTDSRN